MPFDAMPTTITSPDVARKEILTFAQDNKSVMPAVERLLHTAARALSMPAAFLAVYDADHDLKIHSWYGFDASASPDSCFLNTDYALEEGITEIHDASRHTTFAHDVWVINGGVRFFACVPVTTAGGARIGILAVLDSEPRTLTSDQSRLLNEFGRMVSDAIMLRLEAALLRQTARRAERARLHLEKRLDRLVAGLPLPLVAVDREGTILSWNRASVDRFGITPEESLGRSVLALIAHGDHEQHIAALIERVYRRRRISGITLTLKDRDGEPVHSVARLLPFFDPDGDVEACIIILTDTGFPTLTCTEVDGSPAQGRPCENFSGLKTAFLENMSHEIRTPLTSIIGFADLLHAHVDDASRQFTYRIEHSAQQLMDTLTAVLELAQLESGALEMGRRPVDLAAETESVAREYAARAADKNLSFDVVRESDAPAIVDPAGHARVVRHLLDNAIKYTHRGSVSIRIHAGEDRVAVEVADTGIGIGKDFLPDLFKDFTQESTGFSRTHRGTGLGLAIARRLVDLMGGTIDVTSTRGEGSTFVVSYPRATIDAA